MPDKSFPDLDAYGELSHKKKIKVLSWNIWWKFENYLKRQDLIFYEIKKLAPDILCLQEVWEDKDGSQAQEISNLLGYEYKYFKSYEFDGVSFGNSIISRYPIIKFCSHLIPTKKEFNENRSLLHAELLYNEQKINVLCTHLNYKYNESDIRQDQIKFILSYIGKLESSSFPNILCGDFNADPMSDEIRMIVGLSNPIDRVVLKDVWQINNPDNPGYTWSNKNIYAKKTLEPNRRIDYIFVGNPGKNGLGHPIETHLVGAEMRDNIYPSDHFGIITHLEG